MKKEKKQPAKYLSFTRIERVGMICLTLFMMLASLIPYFLAVLGEPEPTDTKAFENEIAHLKLQQEDSTQRFTAQNYSENAHYNQPSERNYYSNTTKGELFYFDPNTISADEWKKLGVRDKTANTIRNYISKGGRFYKPEDIGKIWGLHEDEVKRLLPYVRIEGKTETSYNKNTTWDKNKTYEKPAYSIVPIDINYSDTAAFIALPGIGSKLAARIVAFREKLGGFYKVEQLAETYGLPDSTFQKIKARLIVGSGGVKKLNINTFTVDEMKAHPYLRYNIANAIIQYRTQHGSFSAVDEIKKIMLITEEIYTKAAPYLTIK